MRLLNNVLFIVFSLCLLASCSKDDNDNNVTNGKSTAVFNPDIKYGTMTDQDGNVYKTVTIGTQTWMAENLRTTKYNDGTVIPNVTSSSEWSKLTTGAYCNYNNVISKDTIDTYGHLYNWYAVNTEKLAPKGWHVPTNVEWTTLISYLGGKSTAGSKLKEIGITHWKSPNTDATNESGFTALPGGYRCFDGAFDDREYYFGGYGWWWSSNAENPYAYYSSLGYDSDDIDCEARTTKQYGFSVRCVKDN